MTELPKAASELAGFVLAHAAWSVSDTAEDELLCPLAIVEHPDGTRDLLRFEAKTQEQAIAAGREAMREATLGGAAAWALAEEGTWRPPGAPAPRDVLAVGFWARGMATPVTLVQPFERYTAAAGRFRLLGAPALMAGGALIDGADAQAALEAVDAGVMTHDVAAQLWQTWR